MGKIRDLIKRGVFILLQGGMGIGVSDWIIARAVAMLGAVATVSGTAIQFVFVRRLQLGDPGGHMKRAVDTFPFQKMAQRIYEKYFIPGGKKKNESFIGLEMFTLSPSRDLIELTILANFAEVYLAKEGHDGIVGINFLEKVQMPHIFSIYGAMLAGVDFIAMGAGVPKQIPGVIDGFIKGEAVRYNEDVTGAPTGSFSMNFDPKDFFEGEVLPELKSPEFFPIVAYETIAKNLERKHPEKCAIFIVEGPAAAGHNAPPREKGVLSATRELAGIKEKGINLEVMRSLEAPFILAGGYASASRIAEAKKEGACGVQLGSIFALAEESPIASNIKNAARRGAFNGDLQVITSPVASPTGLRFKCAKLPGTLIDPVVYEKRKRVCDVGLLRVPYLKADGGVGYRCPAEPIESFVAKGGDLEKCEGKICLCNGLLALIDLPQIRSGGYVEPPIQTLGEDIGFIRNLMDDENSTYSVEDVLLFLTLKSD